MKRGFSLIEVIVYVSIISIIAGVFGGMVIAISRSYSKLAVMREMDIAGITAMERMTRSIRSSTSIDIAGSTLDVNPGVLSLDYLDVNEVNTRTIFQVTNQNIQIRINDVDQGVLLPEGVTVSSLIFRRIDTGRSEAVRVEMRLVTRIGNTTADENYYSTIILRGTYE